MLLRRIDFIYKVKYIVKEIENANNYRQTN